MMSTTTSARAYARAHESGNATSLGDLVFPPNLLSTNERHLAEMQLQRVRPERRQAVLDVLVHQLQNGAIRSPIGYLRSLTERELLGVLADLRPASEAGDSPHPLPRDEVAERVAQLNQEIHSSRQFIERLKSISRASHPVPQQQADHSERLKREEECLSAAIAEIRALLRQRPDLIAAGSKEAAGERHDE